MRKRTLQDASLIVALVISIFFVFYTWTSLVQSQPFIPHTETVATGDGGSFMKVKEIRDDQAVIEIDTEEFLVKSGDALSFPYDSLDPNKTEDSKIRNLVGMYGSAKIDNISNGKVIAKLDLKPSYGFYILNGILSLFSGVIGFLISGFILKLIVVEIVYLIIELPLWDKIRHYIR